MDKKEKPVWKFVVTSIIALASSAGVAWIGYFQHKVGVDTNFEKKTLEVIEKRDLKAIDFANLLLSDVPSEREKGLLQLSILYRRDPSAKKQILDSIYEAKLYKQKQYLGEVLSVLMPHSLTAPLVFSDKSLANDILKTLSVAKDIKFAILLDDKKNEFVSYIREDADSQKLKGIVSSVLKTSVVSKKTINFGEYVVFFNDISIEDKYRETTVGYFIIGLTI